MRALGITGVAVLVALAACSATPVNQGAEHVKLTNSEPGKECKLLGDVTGNQGNLVTGGVTSNSNLETGARNDVKNKVAAMGGNVVYVISMRNSPSGTSVTISGSAYHCPE